MVQIDGLSAARLARALDGGVMPTLARLCGNGCPPQARLSAGPPSTPVFQSAFLYGRHAIVHGYSWFDRVRGRVVRMDVPEDIMDAEGALAAGASRPPLFAAVGGAASYFMGFLGGAARYMFTIADGMRPKNLRRTEKLLAGILRGGLRAPAELVRALRDRARFVRRTGMTQCEWNFVAMRVLTATFFEEVAQTFALLDFEARAPLVYINFMAYDEAGHRRGPDDPQAWAELARIDRRLGRLLPAAEAHGYDVVVMSDHGQAAATPFVVAAGRSLAATVFAACAPAPVDRRFDALVDRLDAARVGASRVLKWGEPFGRLLGAWSAARARRAARRLEREYGVPAGELAVVTGGSIAHVYAARRAGGVALEELQVRHPRLLPALRRSPGIGLVIARRSVRGPIVMWRDRVVPLRDTAALAELEPFRRVGTDVLVRLLATVASAETAGDLIVYGAFAAAGAVTFEPELGSHGGVHPDELDLFVVAPSCVELPGGVTLDAADLGASLRAHYAGGDLADVGIAAAVRAAEPLATTQPA